MNPLFHSSAKPSHYNKSAQTLQMHTATQLREMLDRNGFKVLDQCAIDGSKLVDTEIDCIVTIAQKQ